MNFVKALWHEIEPILNHGVAAALIALVAVGLRLLQMIMPPDYVNELRVIDHILVVALSWLFGGYTVTLLLIRLSRNIYYAALKGDEVQLASRLLQPGAPESRVLGDEQRRANELGQLLAEPKSPIVQEKPKS